MIRNELNIFQMHEERGGVCKKMREKGVEKSMEEEGAEGANE